MITGREHITQWLSNNGPYWKLYYGKVNTTGEKADQAPPIQVCDTDTAATETEAKTKFSQLLAALSPGVYTLKANNATQGQKVNFSRGFFSTFFEIPAYETNPGYYQQQQQPAVAGTQPAVGYVSVEEMERKFQERLAKLQADNELKEMKAQLKELTSQQGIGLAQIGSFFNMLAPHAPKIAPFIESAANMLMGVLMPKTALMSGVMPQAQPQNFTYQPQNTTMENTETQPEETLSPEREQLAKDAINVLFQADPQLPEHLNKLAKMAQTNPAQFSFLMNMLDQQPV
ncbi:MAG: hypothetical protein ACXWW0_00130 [Bacteroidia bacterium]